MKPSLKRKLYVHIFIVAAGIILSNRFAAQAVLLGQLEGQAWQDMGTALIQCESDLTQSDAFQLCAQELKPYSVSSVFSHGYKICVKPEKGTSDADPICLGLEASRPNWALKGHSDDSRVSWMLADVQGVSWMGVRRAEQKEGATVWMRQAVITAVRDDMWTIRDRNLGYVLPIILAMLGFLTLSVTYLVMRPIRLLESTLASLTSTNLGQATNLAAPYVEFERIVETFEDLRDRLNLSFLKARRFAADASHELRTPLTILRGNTEQLINELPVGSDMQVRVRLISEEIERLVDITEKLLLLSRADGNSMVKEESDFAISEFLHELVSDSHVFHPDVITLEAIQPHLCWVCDQRLMQQLIYNLYYNAIKYNVPNGWIRIALHAIDDQLVLEFENPAEDIPPQLPELAFDRFYRGNASHSRKIDGLGLGLSLCQEIARLHEAHLALTVSAQSTVLLRLVMPLKKPA